MSPPGLELPRQRTSSPYISSRFGGTRGQSLMYPDVPFTDYDSQSLKLPGLTAGTYTVARIIIVSR